MTNTINQISKEELEKLLDSKQNFEIVCRWLSRGDGCAVYENMDMSDLNIGHKQFVSFGSSIAQIEKNIPPETMPDIDDQINWRYKLVAICR